MSARHANEARLYGAFGLAVFLTLALSGDTRLIYRNSGFVAMPYFSATWEFARAHFTVPAGPVRYAAAYLMGFYASSWLGALILAAPALVLGPTIDAYTQSLFSRRAPSVRYVPALITLFLARMVAPQLSLLLAVTFGVVGAAAYVRMARGTLGNVALRFALLGLPLYYLAGVGFLVYAALVFINEAVHGARSSTLVSLMGMELVPYGIGVRLLGEDVGRAFLEPWLGAMGGEGLRSVALALSALVLLAPVTSVALAVIARRVGEKGASPTPGRPRKRQPPPRSSRVRALTPVQRMALPFVTVAAITIACNQLPHRLAMQVTDRVLCGDWEGVLRTARKPPLVSHPSTYVSNQANRALFAQGRLLDEMFTCPQGVGTLGSGSAMPGGLQGYTPDTHEQRVRWANVLWPVDVGLGLIGSAEHYLHESLANLGPQPEGLEALAVVNTLKGKPEAALVFARALAQQPSQSTRARRLIEAIEMGGVPQRPDLANLDARPPAADISYWGASLERRLTLVLEQQPDNRMALEYLAACHLLVGRPEEIVPLLPRFREQGYTELPRHLAEALLLVDSTADADMAGFAVPLAVRVEFSEFGNAISRVGAPATPDEAVAALGPRFGNTYWFYVSTGVSGVGER